MKSKITEKRCFIVCPLCGSTRIHLVAGGMTGYLYQCRDCDYQGPIRLEANEDMVRVLREEYRKQQSGDEPGEKEPEA
jgi:predicted RNA-binding Zn-ribbon protein involved in translation (DUF1610 family)